jgi:hypothetical protein
MLFVPTLSFLPNGASKVMIMCPAGNLSAYSIIKDVMMD